MSRIISWLSTKNGQKFTQYCIGGACVSTLGLFILVNGPFVGNIREMIWLHKRGKPKPLSDEVEKLVKEVIRDCKLKEDEKEKIQFFNVVGEDLYHLGSTYSPWGAIIGLPFYFDAPENINFNALRFREHESIDWVIEGQDFMEALNLPENAKKFAMMREIYSCNTWDSIENSFIMPGCIAFSALFARRVNRWRDAFTKSFKSRLGTYAICFSLGFFLYRLLQDPMKHIRDKEHDKLAASTGPDYLEGGIKFYEHMLKKNKALRELLGKKGENMYDQYGNENYFIFVPKLPIWKRLELLRKLKEDNLKSS